MMSLKHSKRRKVEDWTAVNGAQAEIIQYGQTMAVGTIDGVTKDGRIVWVQDITGSRKLYERCESFEVWVPREDLGLNYKVSAADF
ncbi:hypothetical protein ACIQF8_17140 [Pseudarthrobacter sp. NPDC092184]|uniref:hypothetical protein n=1 Tax=unclassified Pseudarthrobacter TaxID=2647000 RepID=UPI0037FCD6EE